MVAFYIFWRSLILASVVRRVAYCGVSLYVYVFVCVYDWRVHVWQFDYGGGDIAYCRLYAAKKNVCRIYSRMISVISFWIMNKKEIPKIFQFNLNIFHSEKYNWNEKYYFPNRWLLKRCPLLTITSPVVIDAWPTSRRCLSTLGHYK